MAEVAADSDPRPVRGGSGVQTVAAEIVGDDGGGLPLARGKNVVKAPTGTGFETNAASRPKPVSAEPCAHGAAH